MRRTNCHITRKRFSEKPIAAFTNTYFILFHAIYTMTNPVWSHVLALSLQLPGELKSKLEENLHS